MSEIEIGEYVRTREGYIGKLIQINIQDYNYLVVDTSIKIRKDGYPETYLYLKYENIAKHRKNITDLIEVGDYVNGLEVLDIYIPKDVWDTIEIRVNDKYTNFIIPDEIESIVTKEQLERVKYKVGD